MTRSSLRWAVPVLAGVALLVAGCDSPPEAEKKAADSAVAAAKSAEAKSSHAPQATPSPSLRGLCTAYQAGATANNGKALSNPAFSSLVAAAGGKDEVAAYCTKLVGAPPTHPAGKPSSVPSGKPTAVPSVAPTAHPTGKPTALPTTGHPTGSPTTHPSHR